MKDKVIEIICEIIDNEENYVESKQELSELDGWDSLAQVRMISEIEFEFGVSIPLDKALTLKTIDEYVNLIRK